MSFDHDMTTTITIPKPPRRLLASLREAVLTAQHEIRDPEQGRTLADLEITVIGDKLELVCKFGPADLDKD